MAGNISSMCPPLLFPLSLFSKMLANPSHVSNGVIFSLKNAGTHIGNGDGKFKSILGLVPEFAIFVELEPSFFVFDNLFQGHRESPALTPSCRSLGWAFQANAAISGERTAPYLHPHEHITTGDSTGHRINLRFKTG